MEQRTVAAFVSCQKLRGVGGRRRHMEELVEEMKAGEAGEFQKAAVLTTVAQDGREGYIRKLGVTYYTHTLLYIK